MDKFVHVQRTDLIEFCYLEDFIIYSLGLIEYDNNMNIGLVDRFRNELLEYLWIRIDRDKVYIY